MKIKNMKNGSINEAERLEIGRLLLKAGYTVRVGKERETPKSQYVHYVEYSEDGVNE